MSGSDSRGLNGKFAIVPLTSRWIWKPFLRSHRLPQLCTLALARRLRLGNVQGHGARCTRSCLATRLFSRTTGVHLQRDFGCAGELLLSRTLSPRAFVVRLGLQGDFDAPRAGLSGRASFEEDGFRWGREDWNRCLGGRTAGRCCMAGWTAGGASSEEG